MSALARTGLLLAEDLDTSSSLPASADKTNKTLQGISETDIFAERKKKLQSRVMTQSMPEIRDMRDIRSLYNRGIGNSIKQKPFDELEEAQAKSSRPTLDSDAFDSLFSNL
jgi:S-adenosylmethionine:diacylglycerol 3-amino-3-carboxypropyl transferase